MGCLSPTPFGAKPEAKVGGQGKMVHLSPNPFRDGTPSHGCRPHSMQLNLAPYMSLTWGLNLRKMDQCFSMFSMFFSDVFHVFYVFQFFLANLSPKA